MKIYNIDWMNLLIFVSRFEFLQNLKNKLKISGCIYFLEFLRFFWFFTFIRNSEILKVIRGNLSSDGENVEIEKNITRKNTEKL